MPNTGRPSLNDSMDGIPHSTTAFNQWNDDERNVNVNRNDNDWNDNWWFAGVRDSLHFSPRASGVEFLISCPFQPPSILPTSSSGMESAAYFFVSSDFVSQSIKRKIFNVSSFRIASRTHGCFSVLGRNPALATASISATNSLSILFPSVYRWVFGMV